MRERVSKRERRRGEMGSQVQRQKRPPRVRRRLDEIGRVLELLAFGLVALRVVKVDGAVGAVLDLGRRPPLERQLVGHLGAL